MEKYHYDRNGVKNDELRWSAAAPKGFNTVEEVEKFRMDWGKACSVIRNYNNTALNNRNSKNHIRIRTSSAIQYWNKKEVEEIGS